MNEVSCPLCGSREKKQISSGLFKCLTCKCAFNISHKLPGYSDSYFTSDYKNQYGKTYEEDFEHIYSISLKRIKKIKSLSSKNLNSLMDIGSALGFFLKCASDSGFSRVAGIEISKFASDYARSKFGIETLNCSIDNAEITEKFDVITAWYFIEHNFDPLKIINKIYENLNSDGIFAMSVPSIYGPLYYYNREKWVETHPEDHRVDFSPFSVKSVLKKAGFRKIIIYPSGFHPERIMKSSSKLFPFFKIFYKLYSDVFKFSDTIEVYAVK